MNVVLLIAVTLTLPFVHGIDNKPCQKKNTKEVYKQFVKNHILQEVFDRNSKDKWEEYIRKRDLCERQKQSFFERTDEGRVNNICNGRGRPLLKERKRSGMNNNLCMSDSVMRMYYLEVDNNCKVRILKPKNKKVIVACDDVMKQCLPVHFEKLTNQKVDVNARPCGL